MKFTVFFVAHKKQASKKYMSSPPRKYASRGVVSYTCVTIRQSWALEAMKR
jgi:hypothetical protein